ncbi:MAG: IPT/TIG domain-containing protein [Acidimicrobiales bacterium]|jgi:hypothetical protein
MKRVTAAFGAGLLALGIAASASLVGAPASLASTKPAPTVTSISPSSGPGSGGTVVTVTGTNLSGATKVDFVESGTSFAATDVRDVSPTKVEATSPTGDPNDDPYDVTVTTKGGTSATNAGDEFNYTADPTAGTISVKASNLSILKGDKLTITGTGWTPGLLVIITICNADASNLSPLTQLSEFDFSPDACGPITIALSPSGSFAEVTLSGPRAGDFTWTGTLTPGQLDPSVDSPLAECPQDQVQAAEGVNCIVGAAELVGFSSDGNTADARVFFAPPALSSSDAWQSGLGTSAEYDVTLYDNGAFTESGDPPVATASGVPNTGGFATDGVICEAGTGPGSSPSEPCSPELKAPAQNGEGVWTVSPTGCQAASFPDGAAWSPTATPLCTYGAAVGEPILIELTGYTAPKGTSLTNSIPIGQPLDCSGGSSVSDPFTCTVEANAGADVFDPGGFNSGITDSTTGQSPPPDLQDMQPGKYSFEAIGESSGNIAKGSVTLRVGPSS